MVYYICSVDVWNYSMLPCDNKDDDDDDDYEMEFSFDELMTEWMTDWLEWMNGGVVWYLDHATITDPREYQITDKTYTRVSPSLLTADIGQVR